MSTVEVSTHDLHRLLLMFRAGLEEHRPAHWRHHVDYDISFERLADAVEKAEGHADPRMRCKHDHDIYTMPGPVTARWVSIRYGQPGHLVRIQHLSSDRGGGFFDAVCGMSFAKEDIVTRPGRGGYERCGTCVRELGFLRNVTVLDGQR